MKFLFRLLFYLTMLTGCETVIDLDLRNDPGLLVVDGTITNIAEQYYVVLRYTTRYSFADTTDLAKMAGGAQVQIKDDLGHSETLSEWRPGVYRTDSLSGFCGVVGRSYSIDITTASGRHYASTPELMKNPVPIDSIYTIFDPQANEGAGAHKVYVDYTDPLGEDNNYRWLSYLDTHYLLEADIDNDRFVDGRKVTGRQILGLRAFQAGLDTLSVKIRQAALTRGAYNFWTIYYQQYNAQDNSPYDIPPAPLIGNIFNANNPDDFALGYFNVMGVSEAEIVLRK